MMLFRWLPDMRVWPVSRRKGNRRHESPRRKRALMPAVEVLENRTVPSTVTWINPGGGDWSLGSNWSTGTTPGASDDAIISQPGNIAVNHAQAGTDTIHSLVTSDTLTLSGGILNAETVQNTGTIAIAGGSMLAVNHYLQSGGTTRLQGGTLGAFLPPENAAPTFAGGGFVQAPGAASLSPTSQMTVEAWINPSALSSPLEGIAGTWDDLTGANRSYLLWVQDGKVAFYLSHDGTDYPSVVSTTTLQPNEWYHVAGTFDGTNLQLYVNGVLEATQAAPGTIHANGAPFYIGRVDGGGHGPTFFDGQIADVRLWNAARSQSDIEANMSRALSGSEPGLAGYWPLNTATGGTVLDQTTNQNNGTLGGVAPSFDPVRGGTVDIQGGTLTGAGTIQGDVASAGVVSPGDAPGVLTIRGDYTETATGVLSLPIAGTIPGSQFGQLKVTGHAALGGTLNVSLLDGFVPANGQVFAVVSFGSVSGSFATTRLPTADGVAAFASNLTAQGLSLVGATLPPTSKINPLPAFSAPAFTVSWTGQDNPGGTGIASFDVFVSDNGGSFAPFVTSTATTSATFAGQRGHTYAFYSVATDREGNREAAPSAAEAVTTVPTHVSTTTALTTSAASGSAYGQSVTFTATVSANLSVFGIPTGSVTFLDGATPLATVPVIRGSARYTTDALERGSHAITAVFGGSGDFVASTSRQLVQPVQTVALEPDPLDPNKKDLVVGGTRGNDLIEVRRGRHGNSIEVTVQGTSGNHFRFDNVYAAAGLARVIVFGGAGNDFVRVDPDVTLPALLFAGGGNNVLMAGGGPSVLVGGAGTNVLIAGTGPSILIGGSGHSRLLGGKGSDVLIGGSTAYDANVGALCALMAEWGRTDESYHTRISHLEGPGAGGSIGGRNGPLYLNPTTVHEGAGAMLAGGGGMDWFFGDLAHDLIRKRPGEIVTSIHRAIPG